MAVAARATPPDRSDRRATLRSALGVLIILLTGGFCLLSVSTLYTMHGEIRDDATRSSRNLLNAEANAINGTLTGYDRSLLAAADALMDPATETASPGLRHLALFSATDPNPYLGPVRILDATGGVIFDSSTLLPGTAAAVERTALSFHRRHSESGVHMGLAYATAEGGHAITLSRRISTPGGDFAGIVVGTVDLDLFFEPLHDLHLGPHDAVSLFSIEGVVLAHAPEEHVVGRTIAGTVGQKHFLLERSGVFTARSALDGVDRAFSFTHVADWPLVLDVGLSTHDMYAAWQHRVAVTAMLLAAMSGFTLLVLWLLRRDVHAQEAAQRALAASEARYRLLAESATDLIVRIDRNMIRTYVSPSSRKFGYEPEELVGQTGGLMVHEEDLASAARLLANTIENQVEGELVCRIRHKGGRYSWIEAHLSPIETGGCLAVIRDIDRRKLDEQLQEANRRVLAHLASTDGLTKLANRRIFDEALSSAWEEATCTRRPLSLLMLDVDNFKLYNDHYGHQAGDEVLRQVAQLIGRNVKRGTDVAARYGGEEFAVLLPFTELDHAAELAHRIRSAVWDADLDHVGSASGRVTISIGVACVVAGGGEGSPDALVKAADEALYRSKQRGRNQVQAAALA